MILDKLKAYGAIAAAIALGALLLVQTGRLHFEQREHTQLKAKVDRDHAARNFTPSNSPVRNCAAEVNNTGLTTMRSIQQRNAHAPLFHIHSQGG